MLDYKEIGARIRHQRIKQKITQEKLSERVNISTVYLSKIENGHVHPTLDLLDAICTELDCEIDLLFPGSGLAADIYEDERIVQLYHSCSPKVKPIALELLEKLSLIAAE